MQIRLWHDLQERKELQMKLSFYKYLNHPSFLPIQSKSYQNLEWPSSKPASFLSNMRYNLSQIFLVHSLCPRLISMFVCLPHAHHDSPSLFPHLLTPPLFLSYLSPSTFSGPPIPSLYFPSPRNSIPLVFSLFLSTCLLIPRSLLAFSNFLRQVPTTVSSLVA